ncbi:sulfurtransferase [Peptacetobacter hominis]|uniref:thiosulfate sulfurtransferase n=1 Tax=Peptacetobacter hominis TaxID=2743610 RepID=A0A544QW64_9FIRM|nr:sulfurtransferase [Peptacetobacter hominis]TQQ84926.1 sulfurtransferase [Peptacetobacter hominis]
MKIKSKKIMSLFLASVLAGSMFVGCSKQEDTSSSEETAQTETTSATTKDEYTFDNNEYFTSITWLKDNMESNDKLVIIDARADKDYNKGHIPGAINVIWQALANVEGKAGDKDWGTLQDAETLSKTLSSFGISNDSQVVVYAAKDGWGDDGRVVWCLKRAGIDARMLNGGINLWEAEGNEMSKDAVTPEATECTISEIKPDMNITTEDLKKEYDSLKIIDARAEDEYNGAVNFGEARGGHLPGAISIPFTELYNEDGTIKSNEEIEAIMTEAGINKDDAVVTYCTAGIRSAYMALVMTNAGYTNVRNYDASFYEWAADEANELE